MTTYSGRYEIDQSSYVINIRFDRHSASNYGRYIFGRAESYRNGRRVQVVDDVADPKSGESNRWTGGDFPDYIQFNECDGDFVVTNYK